MCLFFRCCSFGVAGTRWAAGGGVGRSSRSSSSACVGTFVPLCHAARPAPPAVGFIKLCGHGCRLVAAIWAVCAVDAHRERILLLPNRFLGGIHTTSVMASCGVYIYIYTVTPSDSNTTPRHTTCNVCVQIQTHPPHPSTPRPRPRAPEGLRGARCVGTHGPVFVFRAVFWLYKYGGVRAMIIATMPCGFNWNHSGIRRVLVHNLPDMIIFVLSIVSLLVLEYTLDVQSPQRRACVL